MPFDPSPIEPVTHPSREGLIQWLEQQPPEKEYDFFDCKGNCAIGQYMKFIGIPWKRDYTYERICVATDDGGYLAYKGKHTFGAMLERALADNN